MARWLIALIFVSAVTVPARAAAPDDTEGWTPLHFAAAKGDAAAVQQLLEHGVPVDVRNANGRTPLYEAAKRGQLQTVMLLVKRGAAVDARAKVGFSPLHIAAEQKQLEVAKFLIASGANVNARNDHGQTPLWQASWQTWHRDGQMAELLIAHGADVRLPDEHGNTPLALAANQDDPSLVKRLLDAGADVNFRVKGWSARQIAEQHGHQEVAQILRARGAKEFGE